MVSKDGTKRRKIVAELKPTYKCNQRCIFCLWEHRKRLPRMDIKKLKLVTDYMRESLKPDAFILSGGEPMVLKDFPEILDIVRQNLTVEVFHLHTNATLVPAYFSQLSRGVAKLQSATVSLHGHNSQIQDSNTRVEGSFFKAVKGIRMLLDIGYEVCVVCVVSQSNYRYLNDITDFLLEFGSHKVEIRLPFEGPRTNLSSIIPEKKLWADVIESWSRNYAKEPRVCLSASEALCFGKRSPLSPIDRQLSYHFFDVNTTPGSERGSIKQLSAIWRNAFNDYGKSLDCHACLYDSTCKGFSPLEINAGFAIYKPFTLEELLKIYWDSPLDQD